jgi:hypothetical protein
MTRKGIKDMMARNNAHSNEPGDASAIRENAKSTSRVIEHTANTSLLQTRVMAPASESNCEQANSPCSQF